MMGWKTNEITIVIKEEVVICDDRTLGSRFCAYVVSCDDCKLNNPNIKWCVFANILVFDGIYWSRILQMK